MAPRFRGGGTGVMALMGRGFSIGEELSAALRTSADTSAANLAAQASPESMEHILPFEARLIENSRELAGIMAGLGN
jgi:hypothetical protein